MLAVSGSGKRSAGTSVRARKRSTFSPRSRGRSATRTSRPAKSQSGSSLPASSASPVFRYQDTEGAKLETYDYQPAEFPPLFDVAERLGVKVTYLPFVERYRGYYRPSENAIVLCSHDVEVFFHELAHAAHDRIGKLKGGQVASQEIVAETVAAVLCHLYGHDGYLWHGAEYVKSYAKGQNPGRAALRLLADVQAVLDLILDPWSEHKAAESAELVAA
jgi:antirestriction protein ArdC